MSGLTVRPPDSLAGPTGSGALPPGKSKNAKTSGKRLTAVDAVDRVSGPPTGVGRSGRSNVVALRAKGKTKVGIDHAAARALGARVSEVAPNVFLFYFTDAERMAMTLMRFQEHYESPRFAGTVFTRAEFESWYASEHDGRFTYAKDWGGFNVPSRVFAPFVAGEFAPLTADEQHLLDAVAGLAAPFYVIASASDEVVPHETAHGLFATDSDYRREVLKILARVDVAPAIAALRQIGYHESSCLDETHAYLRDGGAELAKAGVDLSPYRDAISDLKALYTRHRAKATRTLQRRKVA